MQHGTYSAGTMAVTVGRRCPGWQGRIYCSLTFHKKATAVLTRPSRLLRTTLTLCQQSDHIHLAVGQRCPDATGTRANYTSPVVDHRIVYNVLCSDSKNRAFLETEARVHIWIIP